MLAATVLGCNVLMLDTVVCIVEVLVKINTEVFVSERKVRRESAESVFVGQL